MKKFIAVCLSALMFVNAGVSAFAGDDIGGTFVIDFEDIMSEANDEFSEEIEAVDEGSDNEETTEEIEEDFTENTEEESVEETTDEIETVEEISETTTNVSIDNDLSEEESKLNEEIENNRTDDNFQSDVSVSETTTGEFTSETTTAQVNELVSSAIADSVEKTMADEDISNYITEYNWSLLKDRGIGESELGLSFTSDFSVGGGATVEGNKYETSIVASSNGGGIKFVPPVDGTFTIAYKVNNEKTANIFGTSAKNTTGASLYVQSEHRVSKGTSYEANVSGSKIQIYYLYFYADEPFDPSYSGVIEEDFIPSSAEKWNLENGLDTNRLYGTNADDSQGSEYIYAGEPMSSRSSSAGQYIQGTTNPVIKNRVPQSGSYITFHAETDGNLYIIASIGSGKTANICNYDDYYNNDSKDMLIKDIHHLYAGNDYYIYSNSSKIKLYQLGFVSGGVLEDDVKDSKITEGIFTVEFGDNNGVVSGSAVQVNTFKEAVNNANGHKATITLNDNYYLTNEDMPNTYVLGNSELKSLKLTSGSDVTLISNSESIARYSIIRDLGNCNLENFIAVGEGATLTIGRNSENSNREAVIFDGGFEYDTENHRLNANESDKAKYGPFILMEGGNLVVNEKVVFTRNYSKGYDGWTPRTGWQERCENTAVIDGNTKYNSTVYLDGIDVTQNFGTGLICANNSMKVTVNKADIYYNESYGNQTGALMVTENKNNLEFTENCDVQIRSNKNYDNNGNVSPYLHDIYAGTTMFHSSNDGNLGININGRLEVGEIHLGSPGNSKVFLLSTNKHKDTIALTSDSFSFYNFQGSNVYKMYAELDNTDSLISADRYNPNIMVKVAGQSADGSTDICYYRAKTSDSIENIKDTTRVDDNGKQYIYYDNIYRDMMIYRENSDNEIGEDTARYGLVVNGLFAWRDETDTLDMYKGANPSNNSNEKEAVMRNKYDKIGFDIVIQEDDPGVNDNISEDAPRAYVSGDRAWYIGVTWNGVESRSQEANEYVNEGAVMVNPVIGPQALPNNHSMILNPELGVTGGAYDIYKTAFFGSEIKNIPANVRFWVRKRFEGSKEYNVEDYIPTQEAEGLSPWVFVDTPSLYTTNTTGYSL